MPGPELHLAWGCHSTLFVSANCVVSYYFEAKSTYYRMNYRPD